MATNTQVVNFINSMGTLVVNECNRRIQAGSGFVLPSVCMAQAAHETGWGTSSLMTKANAYFGIKAGGSWTGKVFTADTREVVDGVSHNVVANFRAYDDPAESVRDYYDLILNNPRYAAGISYHPDKVLSAYDTLYAIWAGGYATEPLYVSYVMNLLNGRDLTQWDAKVDGITVKPDGNYNDYVPPTYETEKSTWQFMKIK